jgi:hypothetical protein
MNNEPDPQLADQIDAALKQLPLVPAPRELAGQVRAALLARAARPWWRREWWHWPVLARAALLSFAAAVIVALGSSSALLDVDPTNVSQLGARLVPAVGYPGPLETLVNAGHVLWERAVAPQILHFGAGLALLYLVCVGLGTVYFRFALKRA